MSVEPKKYVRRPFEVDAVEVTAENMEEVAEWCKGTIKETDKGAKYITTRVLKALYDRQRKAFVGDFILRAGSGFKIYTAKAFVNCFDLVEEP